jgi:HEPN domain-containing protein
LSLPKVVRQWFKLSLNDLKTARALEPMGRDHRAAAAFFSQQSVEKAIKGYLAFHQTRFPKTHKIKELLAILKTVDAPLAQRLKKTEKLSKYAVGLRYPDAQDGTLTKAKVTTAVKLADETYNLISAGIESRRKD